MTEEEVAVLREAVRVLEANPLLPEYPMHATMTADSARSALVRLLAVVDPG